MVALAFFAVPVALVWMIVTGDLSAGSFSVGYVLGIALLALIRTQNTSLNWKQLPDQIVAFVVYTVTLGRDVVIASLDVTRRVLDPTLPLQPGIITVHTQDDDEDEITAAFSAHGITLTPGELVVDFDGAKRMYVHCLDVNASYRSAPGAQTKRLALLRRMWGKPA
jgi:multicomponent Na+:H+ antiporter subunit E